MVEGNAASGQRYQSPRNDTIAISLSDLPEDIEFKRNVCYPYFKDIFRVSCAMNHSVSYRN